MINREKILVYKEQILEVLKEEGVDMNEEGEFIDELDDDDFVYIITLLDDIFDFFSRITTVEDEE